MHMKFRHLRTIQAIPRRRGWPAQAETMNITQSALSHQVKGLEAIRLALNFSCAGPNR